MQPYFYDIMDKLQKGAERFIIWGQEMGPAQTMSIVRFEGNVLRCRSKDKPDKLFSELWIQLRQNQANHQNQKSTELKPSQLGVLIVFWSTHWSGGPLASREAARVSSHRRLIMETPITTTITKPTILIMYFLPCLPIYILYLLYLISCSQTQLCLFDTFFTDWLYLVHLFMESPHHYWSPAIVR